MSKMIRFKIKTLIKIIVIMLVITGLNYLFIPTIMMKVAERYSSKGKAEVAAVYYNRINRYFPNHWETPKALMYLAVNYSRNYVAITPTSFGQYWSGIPRDRGLLLEDEKKIYEELAQRFPTTHQGEQAIKYLTMNKLVNLIENGRIEESLEIYYEFFHQERRIGGNYYTVEMTELMAHLLVRNEYYSNALEVIDIYYNKFPDIKNQRLEELQGDALVEMGKIQEAKVSYQWALENLEKQREISKNHGEDQYAINPWLEEEISRIKAKIDNSYRNKGKGRVAGRITRRGEPMSGVVIMLQPYTETEEIRTFPIGDFSALWVITNDQGEFLFSDLLSGKYGLGFFVDIQRLEGVTLEGGRFPQSYLEIKDEEESRWNFNLVETIKINTPENGAQLEGKEIPFKWEPVPGASYYTLSLGHYFSTGGSMMRNLDRRIYHNEILLPIEELLELEGGYSYDDEGVIPSSFFGYYEPEGKYYWGVNAHQEDGKMITSSIGYLKEQNTDFSFQPRKLRLGDQYLLNRDYEKAIEAYEEELKNNPNDRYALYLLSRIYGFKDKNFPYTNEEKARKYRQRLTEQL